MHEPFSLLVSVYNGDRPDYLRRAFRSAVHDQTVRPDQVIIVRDGPVRAELAECLDELRETSPVPVTFVPLPRNGGLGPALDRGLAASQHDVIARMDADDVAMPHRFEVEIPLIADADIVGSGLLEFSGDTDEIVGQRVPPTGAEKIARYARMHDPFNHPTVVYRRRAVAGGRRLRGPETHGGLRAVRPDAAERRAGGQRGRATGLLPGRRNRLQKARRRSSYCAPNCGCSVNSGRTASPRPRSTCAMWLVRGGYRLIPWWVRRAVYRPILSRGRSCGAAAARRARGG